MKSGPVDVHIHDVMRRNIENFIWSSEVPPVGRLNVLMIDNAHCDKRVRPLLGGTATTGEAAAVAPPPEPEPTVEEEAEVLT